MALTDYIPDALRKKYEQYTSLDPQKDESLGDTALQMGASFIPGVGQAMALRDTERARREGDTTGMALSAASLIPFGKLVGALRKPVQELIAGERGAQNLKYAEGADKAFRRTDMEDTLAAAKEHLAAGHSPDDVWQMHGAYQGAENHGPMKWEIPDTDAKLKPLALNPSNRDVPLRDLIDHPEAFAAYPHLHDIMVATKHGKGATGEGEFIKRTGLSDIKASGRDEDELRRTLLHEMNHAIQAFEGHDPGANADQIAKALRKNLPRNADNTLLDAVNQQANRKYLGNMGEVESRTVENRSAFTPEQLRKFRPNSSKGGMDTAEAYQLPYDKLPGS